MREYASPPTTSPPLTGSLTDDILRNAADHPHQVVLVRGQGDEAHDVTATEFLDQVRAVAKGMLAAGIESGDRVALMSRTRYEWTLLDYAIWFVGAVTVPLYDTSSVDQIRWVLADSGARFALVESRAHAERIQDAASEEPPQVFRCIDDGCVESLMSGGVDIDDETLDDRRSTVSPRSLATIIYTSGTTGRPKGCMLTHGNFMFELGAAVEELDELFARDDASTVLFLPLAHVFARVIQVGAVRQRVRVAFSADIRSLMRDLQASRPTFLLAVPRVFEKIFNTASQNATADGRGKTFDKAAALAIAYSRAVERGRPGRLLKARHSVYDRTVYSRLRASLGGECAYVVSGGAPLGERLGHFYRGIGVTVLEGYGLTETTAAVTVNVPEAVKIGTVGRPLGGSAVRVAEDGELHVRGGQVMSGYWHDPDATEEVLDADGWLRTGDLAEIDDEGFVRITGRKKEILVTAGGKNVAPAALEDTIRAHALVDQCLVVGDRRPFIAALVTIDSDAFGLWAERSGKAGGLRRLTDDPDLRAEIQSAVDEANRTVSQAEAIRKFAILADEWTEEGGQLTPSLKLRRAVVMTQVGRQVEDLYLS